MIYIYVLLSLLSLPGLNFTFLDAAVPFLEHFKLCQYIRYIPNFNNIYVLSP